MLGLIFIAGLAVAAPEPGAPPGYPDGFPYIPGGTLAPTQPKDSIALTYPDSDQALAATLRDLLLKRGWALPVAGGLDPTAGRLFVATKDDQKVMANVGRDPKGAILIVRRAPVNPPAAALLRLCQAYKDALAAKALDPNLSQPQVLDVVQPDHPKLQELLRFMLKTPESPAARYTRVRKTAKALGVPDWTCPEMKAHFEATQKTTRP